MTEDEAGLLLGFFFNKTLTSSDDFATKTFSFKDSGKGSNLCPTDFLIRSGFVIGGSCINEPMDELLECDDCIEDLGEVNEEDDDDELEEEVIFRHCPSLLPSIL